MDRGRAFPAAASKGGLQNLMKFSSFSSETLMLLRKFPFQFAGKVAVSQAKENTMEHTSHSKAPTDRLGHRICDYSDTDYAQFWAGGDRIYEDQSERNALRRLTADMSGTCLEIGAGYGRLVNEYARQCSQVLLTDYAEPLLVQAQRRIWQLGLDNVTCMRLNLYELQRCGRQFDNAICIRVMHHVEAVPDFFRQVNLTLHDGGAFILEYANKRNLLEILRWLFHRPNIGPFDRQPSERKDNVYYNFHPAYIADMLRQNGFEIEQELSVSIFRSRCLKRLLPQHLLSGLDRLLQRPLGPLHLSPSVFLLARKTGPAPRT